MTSSIVTYVNRLAFSPDSSVLGFATVNDQSQLHLWNLNGRKLQAILKVVDEGNYSLAVLVVLFSPNQQDVIACTYDGGLYSRLFRWQVETGKLENASGVQLSIDRMDGLLGLSPDGET